MAALSREEMTDALIGAKKDLVQTFKKFKEKRDDLVLHQALADVAKVSEHIPKVVTCLRTEDPFPTEMSRVSWLVHNTVGVISQNTDGDAESFANVITSFKPRDVKPLASIRNRTLRRKDAVKVLESVMDKSPQLITDDLSRWLANHLFDQNSKYYTDYRVAREQAFQYLTFFATESALNGALSITKANEHYKAEFDVYCCNSQNSYPHDLASKLERLLAFVKARNGRINEALYSCQQC